MDNTMNNSNIKYESIGLYKYCPIPVGQGSFSLVYKGVHINTGKSVAIKKINLTKNITDNHIKSEIEIMKKLKHKNIVQLYEDLYDEYNNVYLIMEYCNAGNLSSFLNKKPLKEKYVKNFMSQIAGATRYLLSNNIIHRDIKPQNIMMIDKNNIKLTDFGFAKIFSSEEDKMAQTICGSPIYMAPEIIKCNHYGVGTDLWSIGIILYEMVVGKPPYRARTHLELIHKIDTEPIYVPMGLFISEDCRKLIFKLLQRNPDKRISWNEFFNHIWFKKEFKDEFEDDIEDELEDDSKINLSKLIIDYDYSAEEPSKPKEIRSSSEIRMPIDMPMNIQKSQPIDIKKDEMVEEEFDFDDSYTSPMFNASMAFSPNEYNGYMIVEPPENAEEKDEKDIGTEREVSQSFMDYIGNTVNYFKTYYW